MVLAWWQGVPLTPRILGPFKSRILAHLHFLYSVVNSKRLARRRQGGAECGQSAGKAYPTSFHLISAKREPKRVAPFAETV